MKKFYQNIIDMDIGVKDIFSLMKKKIISYDQQEKQLDSLQEKKQLQKGVQKGFELINKPQKKFIFV